MSLHCTQGLSCFILFEGMVSFCLFVQNFNPIEYEYFQGRLRGRNRGERTNVRAYSLKLVNTDFGEQSRKNFVLFEHNQCVCCWSQKVLPVECRPRHSDLVFVRSNNIALRRKSFPLRDFLLCWIVCFDQNYVDQKNHSPFLVSESSPATFGGRVRQMLLFVRFVLVFSKELFLQILQLCPWHKAHDLRKTGDWSWCFVRFEYE